MNNMKKKLSVLLAIVIVLTSLIIPVSADTAGSTTDGTYINTGGTLYPVTKGDTYTYEYRLNLGKKLTAIDASLSYDTAGLELVNYTFPILGSSVNAGTYGGKLYFNYASATGIEFSGSSAVLIRATFKVKAENGIFDAHTDIADMARYQEVKIVENGTVISSFNHNELITDDDSKTSIYIETGDKYYKVKRGKTYHYICYLKTDERVGNLEATTKYSSDGLSTEKSSSYYNYSYRSVKTTYQSYSGKSFAEDNTVLVSIPFTVSEYAYDNTTYSISTNISKLQDINEDTISRYTITEVIDGLSYTTVDPNNPPTEAPTEASTTAPIEAPTEPPTTAPTEAPTIAPTEPPTTAPTEAPTIAPTEPPTTAPTEAPLDYHAEDVYVYPSSAAEFRVEGYMSPFSYMKVDGDKVDKAYLTIRKNDSYNTTVTLDMTYIWNLSIGSHDVEIRFDWGVAYCNLNIMPEPTEPVPEPTEPPWDPPTEYYCDHYWYGTYTENADYQYYDWGYTYNTYTYCSNCGQELYVTAGEVHYADKSKCLNFDNSLTNWQGPVKFYVYEVGGAEQIAWGSKRLNGTDNGDGTWSYDPSTYMNLEPGKQYAIIFVDSWSGAQTYALLFDTTYYGDRAYVTGNHIENPVDSNKTSMEARWANNSMGPMLQITSIGNVVGETCPSDTTPYKMLVDFLKNTLSNARNYSGKTDQQLLDNIAKSLDLTDEDVSKAIKEAGVTVSWKPAQVTPTEPPTDAYGYIINGYYLTGTINGNNTGTSKVDSKLRFRESNGDQLELTNVQLNEGDVVRVARYNGGNAFTIYPDGVGREITIDQTGKYNLYFKPYEIGNPNYWFFTHSKSKPILGDVDGDGKVTIMDATFIQRWLEQMPLTITFDEQAADIDADGTITVTDATFIQRYADKTETPYEIGIVMK